MFNLKFKKKNNIFLFPILKQPNYYLFKFQILRNLKKKILILRILTKLNGSLILKLKKMRFFFNNNLFKKSTTPLSIKMNFLTTAWLFFV